MSPAEMDFLGPLVEVGDGLINCKLNTKFAAVLVDFGLNIVGSIVTL